MKKLFLLFNLILISVGIFCQIDTSNVLNGVVQQATQIAKEASGQDISWKILVFGSILGFLVHTIIDTIKGIKNGTNGTPVKFIWKYWIADNGYAKITTLVSLFIGSSWFSKIPVGTGGYIIMGVLAIASGFFLDKLTQFMNIDPKTTIIK
jgi:hypothetical protein